MTAQRDLEAFLARAREIAESSRVASVATPQGGISAPPGSKPALKKHLPPATPATLLHGSPADSDCKRQPELETPAQAFQTRRPNGSNPAPGDMPAEEWRYRFHERAGFLEHDCHQSRREAEQRALHELEGHWLALHPVPAGAPENGCAYCRTGAGAADLLPHVAAGKAHFWLHQRCWSDFEKSRRAQARAALEKLIPDMPGKDALDELLEDLEVAK